MFDPSVLDLPVSLKGVPTSCRNLSAITTPDVNSDGDIGGKLSIVGLNLVFER